jgi:hypothetical protein
LQGQRGASDSRGGGFGVDSLPMQNVDVPEIKVNGENTISSETNYYNYFTQLL